MMLAEIDCIFISYDEPNAERNWADLLNKAPWAKRVHGIKGSDAAHKAAARLSDTNRFITVDADNIVDPKFFEVSIDFDGTDLANKQLSWCGKNFINGLAYGNGGLKCWTKDFVLGMQSHEASMDPHSQVDFCWTSDYEQMANNYSISYVNASPLQAWRAGFREGVKMTLNTGVKQNLTDATQQIERRNYQRLLIWSSIGADVENGLWAIYGARLGCYMTNCTDWDYIQVRDFEYLNSIFDPTIDLLSAIAELGTQLQSRLNIALPLFNEEHSKFFKEVWVNPSRFEHLIKGIDAEEFDIVFISYDEPNADENWNRLKSICPRARRISNIDGIYAAHYQASRIVNTDMFYVVDGDAWITDFNFKFIPQLLDREYIHIFKSQNAVNGLEYGNGAVKLFPKKKFAGEAGVDVTTSLGDIKIIDQIVCETRFNTSPFNTWRAAFRECAKLSSKIIKNQDNNESDYRLNIWKTLGTDTPYGQYCIDGARAGDEYGKNHKESLSMINNYIWLREKFDEFYNN